LYLKLLYVNDRSARRLGIAYYLQAPLIPTKLDDEDENDEFLPLSKLYVLAGKLIGNVSREAIDTTMTALAEEVDSDGQPYYPSSQIIYIIHEGTVEVAQCAFVSFRHSHILEDQQRLWAVFLRNFCAIYQPISSTIVLANGDSMSSTRASRRPKEKCLDQNKRQRYHRRVRQGPKEAESLSGSEDFYFLATF
jgi:hypothetical protein